MIWKNTKKQIWKFRSEKLEESRQALLNPARGWYSVYTFCVEQKIKPEELKWSLREDETVALVLLDIVAFRDRPLDIQALDNIRDILRFFEDYKKDVVFRPVYDREGKGQQHEPEDFSLVLTHLRQIGELLSVERYSVFVFQGLLVGSWGEMHTSRYLSEDCLIQLWNCINPYLKENNIYLAVRTPVQWRIIAGDEKFFLQNLALFDDGILGSMTHLGTFGTMTKEAAGWKIPWMRRDELPFADWLTGETPCGGEVTICEGEKREYTVDFILNELQILHITYLNSAYNMKILNSWKKITYNTSDIWNGCSLYEYIGKHLGYRLVVKRMKIDFLRYGKVKFIIEIKNTGFSRIFQETQLFLVIKNKSIQKRIPVLLDVRKIYSGNTGQATVVTETIESDIFLELYQKENGRTIQFANKNSEGRVYLGHLYNGKGK